MKKPSSYQIGNIVSVSPQGNRMYVILRSIGEKVLDVENNFVNINTYIIGNVYNLPESELKLAEVLILLNVDTDITNIKPSDIIGKAARVEIDDGGMPISASIINTEDIPRSISAKTLKEARFLSKDLKLSSDESIKFLTKIGFSKEEILSIDKESVVMSTIAGRVFKYGDAVTNYKISKSEGSSEVDMVASLNAGIVPGVSRDALKNKSCHLQIKAFSAK